MYIAPCTRHQEQLLGVHSGRRHLLSAGQRTRPNAPITTSFFHFSEFFSLRLCFLLRDCLSFELSVITPSAKQPVKVDQGNTVVALVLRMVQPVEVTAGKFHAIMTSNRSDIGVKLGVQMVERMRLEEKREES